MSGRVVDLFSHAPVAGVEPAYAELHCLSDFSFQRGAASARELFERAAHCGYTALAITDECSLAGIVRAFEAARDTGIDLIVGSEFVLDDGLKLVLLVESLPGYEALCRLITQGRRAALKGQYHLTRADLADGLPGTLALWIPQRGAAGEVADAGQGAWLKGVFGARLWLAVELHRDQDDALRLAGLQALAAQLGIRAVAAGDVHMDIRRRRALQDTMTAIRHNCSIAEAGARLFRNGERHLRTRRALAEVYPGALLDEALRIAGRCGFRLQQLEYRYPSEVVAPGHTPASWLRALTEEGVRERWPGGEPASVRQQVEKELALVAELEYEAYFLTVADIVRFARSRGILCQGRGSAANSAVCYALGVTAVDPASSNLLIERFISKERNEPPDIDIDFEHERREEVIQYIYGKYGRDRAALAATVIRYRGKSAVRDVARALGLPPDQVQQLSDCFGWWNGQTPIDTRLADAGFDPGSALMKRVMGLTRELLDHPRHLSQHVGGFVISDAPLWTLVPVENAAMPDRTILQWDKDDLDTMKLLKVDCLALGMLTCIRKALDLLRAHRGRDLTTATIPQEDPATYAMIQRADTIGVFQIESRAQMTMLPRLRPETFYDLVIEVAIVRPGPIQGGMVHPYLRRRQGKEAVDYPSEKLRKVFERTLGVPLFQEQVMQLVIEAAGYSPGDADQLRRSMAAWRDGGDIERHRLRIRDGMLANAYSQAFIDQIFEQIRGFGSYGFPESHAASFALLVYVSCWIKCHEPAAFACALLNAQPMGFYPPSQITQDARRHGIVLLPVDVATSDWDNTLVGGVPARGADPGTQPDLRLGLRGISGLAEDVGRRLVAARAQRPFADIADLCARARLDERARGLLAEAGALASLSGHRHAARWAVAGIEQQRPLFDASPTEEVVDLPRPTAGEDLLADYRTLGLTLGAHPLHLLRTRLARERCLSSSELRSRRHGSPVRTAGLVTLRQRPSTASGTTFVTLEDEHGMVSVIVWPRLAERQRKQLLGSRLLAVNGRWEKVDGVEHLIAGNLQDLSGLLGGLRTGSRDFH